jgi:shikimate kinase
MLILFGFKRCGKTFYGKKAAEKLGWKFVDTDHLIEKQYGESCREISLKHGEAHFRSIEREVIRNLKPEKNVILSLGGGVILDSENRNYLHEIGTLIYLKSDKETIKERILSSPLPSFLDPNDAEGSFEKMFQEREPIYEKVEAAQINLVGKTEEEVLWEIMHLATSLK